MADGNSLGNALKYLRRHVHLHGHEWRTLVICQNREQYETVFDEVYRVLDSGSLAIESVNKTQGWIQLAKGAMVTFGVLARSDDKFKYAGRQFTQLMWLYEPEPATREYVRALLRSNTVSDDQLVDEKIDW
jgi:hypothetical protein